MSDSIELAVKLPEDLVRDAREFNLLTDEAIAQLLRGAVDQRVNELVDEEIHAYRRKKHTSTSNIQ